MTEIRSGVEVGVHLTGSPPPAEARAPHPPGGARAPGHQRPGRHGRTRLVSATIGCLIVLLILAVVGIGAGSSSLTIGDVIQTLLGGGTGGQELIVFELRMPRVLGGLLVGMALGLAGALTQTFARNPLATPDMLGITAGASLGGVAAIVLTGGSYAVGAAVLGLGVPLVATIGALGAAVLVYAMSWRGGVDSYRLILIGIGAQSVFIGLTSYLVARAKITEAQAAAQWLVGSLTGISWVSVWPVLIVLAIVLPIALSQASDLDVSELGDEMSTGLGVAVQRHRLLVIACAVVLTAAAVSAAGPVGFVAFVAPQIARRLAGTGRPPQLASAFVGGIIVVGGDVIVRGVLPVEVPVGIITAIVGAPYLIWLLTRRRERENTA